MERLRCFNLQRLQLRSCRVYVSWFQECNPDLDFYVLNVNNMGTTLICVLSHPLALTIPDPMTAKLVFKCSNIPYPRSISSVPILLFSRTLCLPILFLTTGFYWIANRPFPFSKIPFSWRTSVPATPPSLLSPTEVAKHRL